MLNLEKPLEARNGEDNQQEALDTMIEKREEEDQE
jgi:hypothetical protein